jgi:two-component system, LytTR family, sensor kinase
MHVRWRQYELIFATALFFVMGADQLFELPYGNTGGHAALFKEHGVSYHYFQNTLLPVLLSHLIPLVLLVLVNSWLLPRLLYHRHRFIILPSAAILGWILLTIAFSTAHYYRFYYLTAKIPVTELQLTGARQALGLSGFIAVIYLLYCCVRETLIRWVNQEHANRPFRVMLCNRITATAFIYVGLLILFGVLQVFTSDRAAILYVFIILPVIIIVFINVYGWFPYRQRMQLPLKPFIWKLLIAPFILSLASWIFYTLGSHRIQVLLLPAQMMVLLVIAIPISWLLYLQQKEKLAMLQLKKDLGKTTADLAFLRSQIHPHFLFNTLNTLYGTTPRERQKAYSGWAI